MGLIRSALRKPISILVIVMGLFFFGINAVRNIKVDIFPDLNLPVLYISHPYGGFTPTQMEAYFAKNYVSLLLFVSGVKSIETRNIQGITLMKLTFYQGTNMAQAAAEVTSFTNRAQAIFPPGSQPPFIIRFDASTLPVGQLVLSSTQRSNNELMDLANVYIRSAFTSIPGLVSPAPTFIVFSFHEPAGPPQGRIAPKRDSAEESRMSPPGRPKGELPRSAIARRKVV